MVNQERWQKNYDWWMTYVPERIAISLANGCITQERYDEFLVDLDENAREYADFCEDARQQIEDRKKN